MATPVNPPSTDHQGNVASTDGRKVPAENGNSKAMPHTVMMTEYNEA